MAKPQAIYSNALHLPERVGGANSGEATKPVEPKPGTGSTAAVNNAGGPTTAVNKDYGTDTPGGAQTTQAIPPINKGNLGSVQPSSPETPVSQGSAEADLKAAIDAAMSTPSTVPGVNAALPAAPAMPTAPTVNTDAMKQLLSAWQNAANQQAQTQVDYATNQAIEELRRAEQDAKAGFKEQAESVALDERQGMDNSALYAEARGDKGGIGQAQYNAIQAAAAQNRLAVQQAQTKLSTDTVRQIADLRAQGEFQKADAMLETAQIYLSQLVQMEQWAAEYGLSSAQFQAAMDQWQAEYDMAMAQYQTSVDQWNREFQYQQNRDKMSDSQWAQEMALTQSQKAQTEQAAMGEALLDAGVMPSAEQLAAMGLTEAQAQQWVMAVQLEAALKQNGAGKFGTTEELYQALREAGATTGEEAKAKLTLWGYESPGNYTDGYVQWYRNNRDQPDDTGTGESGIELSAEIFTALDGYKAQGYTSEQLWQVIDSLNISDEDKLILVNHYGVE